MRGALWRYIHVLPLLDTDIIPHAGNVVMINVGLLRLAQIRFTTYEYDYEHNEFN